MQRHRQSTAATLRVVFTDELGEPETRTSVTVSVDRANGTELVSSTAAAAGDETGEFTLTLSAAQTSTLDVLTATWHDVDNDVDWYTHHRIVGGFMFTLAEARAHDDVLDDSSKYPPAVLAAKRTEVENTAEWICDRAFVPSYARVVADGDGTGQLRIGLHDLRRLRSVTVFDDLSDAGTTLTTDELASISLLTGGVLRRTDGGIFIPGSQNVIVEVEYGLDGPESPMAAAAMTHLVSVVNARKTGIPDRARSMTSPEGTSYVLAGPDAYSTGIDSVDAVYSRYSKRARKNDPDAGAAGTDHLPASATLSYDPQWHGLFRGGPR